MTHPSVVINTTEYESCPAVDIPKTSGGMARYYDTSECDVIAGNVLNGKKFLGASGEDTGSMPNNGSTSGTISTKAGSVTVPEGYTSGGTVTIDSTEQSKIIASNIKKNVTILGVEGALSSATISQDSITKILTIS